jgi:hypothetical protein
VSYPFYLFIYGTYHAHILDICVCPRIHLYIEYNHLDMNGMICTQHPTFSTFPSPLCNYREKNYHSEVP